MNTSHAKIGTVVIFFLAISFLSPGVTLAQFSRQISAPFSTLSAPFNVATGNLNAPPPTLSLAAEPAEIVSGGKSLITWSTTNATSCFAQGSTGSAELPTSGSGETAPLKENQTLSLVCSGPGGTVVQSVMITVLQQAPGPLSVSVSLPPSGPYRIGETMKINWELDSDTLAAENTLALFLVGTGNNLLNARIDYFLGDTYATTSSYDWNIRTVWFGDAGSAVVPGTYKVRAILYGGKNVCLGFCAQNSGQTRTPPKVITMHETKPVVVIEERIPSGDSIAPSSPRDLTVSSSTPTHFVVSWSPSTDNAGVTSYGVYRDDNFLGTTRNTNFTDKGLTPATYYEYKIVAYDAAGNASPASTIVVRTKLPSADVTPPGPPTKLKVGAVLSTVVNLSWLPAKDNVAVTAYNIYRNDEKIATVVATPSQNVYRDVGVATSTTYTYRVRALDAGDNLGSPSNQIRVTTASELPPIVVLRSDIDEITVARPAAKLTWYVERATSCKASGDWGGRKNLTGTTTVKFLSPSKTYVLTCTGPGGPVSESVSIRAALPPPAIYFINSTSTQIRYGELTKITWRTERASVCRATGDWSGVRPTSGTVGTGPVTSDRKYELTCSGETGTTTVTAFVSVGLPVTNASVEPTLITLPKDSGVSVSWVYSSSNASYCRVTQNGVAIKHPRTGELDWPPSGIVKEIGSKLKIPKGVVRVFTCYNGKGAPSNPVVTSLNVISG